MRLESLRVELRPRSAWEAMELGTALVRANARAVWLPWLLVTLPVFAVLNAVAAAFDAVWVAALAMWWLKPLFDRAPLFVLSRAVFGEPPTVAQTIAAQRRWGWRAMRSALTWRRCSLMRALTLPIDLLEGVEPGRLAARRRVIGSGIGGHVALLTLICLCFVVALTLSAFALALLFVPSELLMSESMRALWTLVKSDPPAWVQVLVHAAAWTATSLIEPFYIGAGFGLYLNRRTQIEAWDVEIAFRRMRARLAGIAATLLLASVGLATLAPLPSLAAPRQQTSLPAVPAAPAPLPAAKELPQDADTGAKDPAADPPADTAADAANAAASASHDVSTEDAADAVPLDDVFSDEAVAQTDMRRFVDAVARGQRDPLLHPTRDVTRWTLRKPWRPKKPTDPASPLDLSMFGWLSTLFGTIAEFGLWILLGALVLILALTAKRWWPWMRGVTRSDAPPSPVAVSDAALPDVLPADIASAARALWREGRPRRALALLYRASVEAMALRADVTLVPGATESECLRASRRMPDADDRDAFVRIVRMWQYAAYAQRLPDSDGFETLLGTLSRRFGWAA